MRVSIDGPVGLLSGELWEPEGPPAAAAVLCHPHPSHGGTMRSTVVFRAARALQAAGSAVLRFDFRGVGESGGTHDGQGGEEQDLAACLDWLEARYPGLPRWAGGFSFGARTVAGLLARGSRGVQRVLLIALPVLVEPCAEVAALDLPGLILMAENDAFGTRADLTARSPGLAPGLELDEVPGADHFFTSALDDLQARVGAWANPES